MPILHAIVLGVTQGLSEFLPISSSGHLILVPWLFRWTELTSNPGLNRTFDVALHAGTLVGAVTYFRADLVRLIGAGWRSLRTRDFTERDARLAWLLLASAVPGAIVGALLDSSAEDHLAAKWLIALMLIVFGIVLLIADRMPGTRVDGEFETRDAVVMGVAQAVALVPGVSRSGVTISSGRVRGFDRAAAARLSFLMSLPITGAAVAYKGAKLFLRDGGIPAGFGGAFAVGIIASAITGFLAVYGLLRLVRQHSFEPFVVYRVLAGIGVLVLLATNVR